MKLTFGVLPSPEAFPKAARGLKHPFDAQPLARDHLLQCVFRMLTLGKAGIMAAREAALACWEARAVALEVAEARLHAALPTAVRRVLAGKRCAASVRDPSTPCPAL